MHLSQDLEILTSGEKYLRPTEEKRDSTINRFEGATSEIICGNQKRCGITHPLLKSYQLMNSAMTRPGLAFLCVASLHSAGVPGNSYVLLTLLFPQHLHNLVRFLAIDHHRPRVGFPTV